MQRLSILILVAILSQTGCNTLFNPDKTISTALASYVTDSSTSESGDLEQLVADVEESAANQNVTADSTQPETPDMKFLDIPPRHKASPIVDQEFSISDREPDSQNQPSVPPPADAPLSPQPKTPIQTQTEKDQEELLKIYDKINEFEAPRSAQPLSPLIQRPFLFDRNLFEPQIKTELQNELYPTRSDISWKDSLEATIDHLQEELNRVDEKSVEFHSLQKCLKILNSVESDKSFVELAGKLNSLQQNLPLHQFEAIRQLIQSTDDQKSNLMEQLHDAVEQVAQSANLKINNVAFCTSVQGFGKFKRFADYRFEPGDEVLLYCELENFAETQTTASNSATRKCHFDAQIEFLDENDVTNYVESFANISDECQTPRKDFYLFFRFKIPKLSAGNHRIQIRFNDKIGRKKATLAEPIPFVLAE